MAIGKLYRVRIHQMCFPYIVTGFVKPAISKKKIKKNPLLIRWYTYLNYNRAKKKKTKKKPRIMHTNNL